MFAIEREELDWGGRPLVIETGRLARQATGAALVRYGETSVLATVVVDTAERQGVDFFPLTVNYIEKAYAAGKIPGGYFKREGRPSEKEILSSRLIDRPIRPLFPAGMRNEVQVLATVLSHDLENDPDVVALIASSAALSLSGAPFSGPVGACRVGFDGKYLLNPSHSSQLDLVVAGTRDGVLMVESQAQELSEDTMLEAVTFGHEKFQDVIGAIERLCERAAKPPMAVKPPAAVPLPPDTKTWLEEAYKVADKQERQEALAGVRARCAEVLELAEEEFSDSFKKLEKEVVRGAIVEKNVRIDGRPLDQVRPIAVEVGVLPRAHGSALFTRGETQSLGVATLGTGDDEQFVDALEGTFRESFLLHYNFPPYSVGEVGRVGFTGRREVGHGKLAWRALKPVLPPHETFPYTIRVVSEITESNGSSSMASVCSGSLALMDAGVPLSRAVAGIAMGLIKQEEQTAILSDIIGDEDHLGDMDFKVAGTQKGITALQMDIKIAGVGEEIMRDALAQARAGRLHILEEMNKALDTARPEPGEHAPRIEIVRVPPEKVREVIGTGGKVVREIVETTGAKIDIQDDGTIKVASNDSESIKAAVARIQNITATPEVGKIYEGTVVKIMDFGAFVNFLGARDGLVHISQLADRRVARVRDVVQEGDKVRVKLVGFDPRGKIRLAMRGVQQDS